MNYCHMLTNQKNVFTYLDPPYDIKDNLYGKKGEMPKKFNHDDFATECDHYTGHQLISYNSSQLVKERFKKWNLVEFDHTYTMRSVGSLCQINSKEKNYYYLIINSRGRLMEDYDKEHINDLWEDMDRLNSLYEEMMWDHDDVLEFVPDYKNNRIIIKNKSMETK